MLTRARMDETRQVDLPSNAPQFGLEMKNKLLQHYFQKSQPWFLVLRAVNLSYLDQSDIRTL